MVALRDYQQELFDRTSKAFHEGYRKPLIVAPCGAGKSFLFAKMVEVTNGEVLILTHRQELLKQHKELLKGLGLSNFRISMIMTEANRLGQYEKPRLIVADEAHLSRSNSWVKVIEYYDTFTIGLTATPCRLDGKPLGDIYDTLIEGVDVKYLIENKRLAPYKYYAPFTVDTEGVQVARGDYVTAELDKLMNSRAIYSDVIKSWKALANGEKTIAYCVSVSHAETVARKFRENGVTARQISGETPAKERGQIMQDFRAGKITVLCNVGIISEGVSIDDVSCCLLLRPTQSVALGVQQMMRCQRYQEGKVAKIIDCVGNYTRVGLPDDSREWSLSEPIKKKQALDSNGNYPIRCCPECFLTFKTADVCPYCGAEYPLSPRELKAHEDIQLQLITEEQMKLVEEEKKRKRMEVGQCRTMADLWAIARERGYKPGWVFQMARLKGISR